jgi:hypothetical protein
MNIKIKLKDGNENDIYTSVTYELGTKSKQILHYNIIFRINDTNYKITIEEYLNLSRDTYIKLFDNYYIDIVNYHDLPNKIIGLMKDLDCGLEAKRLKELIIHR